MNFQLQSKRKGFDSRNSSFVHSGSPTDGINGDGDIGDSLGSTRIPLVIPLQAPFRAAGIGNVALDAQAASEIMEEINTHSSLPLGVGGKVVQLQLQQAGSASTRRPLLMANMPSELLGTMSDDERLKRDMSFRADDVSASSPSYDLIPIHEFGAAMLRGMGWVETKEDADNLDKKYSEPLVARESRVGLGATAKPPEKHSRGSKEKKEMDKEKWTQKVKDKLELQQLRDGDFVWIRDPLYAGRRAVIVATRGVPGLDKIRVSMETGGGLVVINKNDAVLLSEDAIKNEPYSGTIPTANSSKMEPNTFHEEPGPRNSDGTLERKRTLHSIGNGGIEDHRAAQNKKKKTTNNSDASSRWLQPGIRVRIISKKSPGGVAAYLQKVAVLDVYEAGTASVRFDDDSVIEGVKQNYLETVLPSVGGICVVLTGEHRGQTAQLLEKRKESDNIVIQLTSELDIVILGMDAVAALS